MESESVELPMISIKIAIRDRYEVPLEEFGCFINLAVHTLKGSILPRSRDQTILLYRNRKYRINARISLRSLAMYIYDLFEIFDAAFFHWFSRSAFEEPDNNPHRSHTQSSSGILAENVLRNTDELHFQNNTLICLENYNSFENGVEERRLVQINRTFEAERRHFPEDSLSMFHMPQESRVVVRNQFPDANSTGLLTHINQESQTFQFSPMHQERPADCFSKLFLKDSSSTFLIPQESRLLDVHSYRHSSGLDTHITPESQAIRFPQKHQEWDLLDDRTTSQHVDSLDDLLTVGGSTVVKFHFLETKDEIYIDGIEDDVALWYEQFSKMTLEEEKEYLTLTLGNGWLYEKLLLILKNILLRIKSFFKNMRFEN